jgi:hypothetical protein
LYVADGTNVDIYTANIHSSNPPLIGQLTGLNDPAGVAVDQKRNVYAVESALGGSVIEFPPGSTTPSRQLDCGGAWPIAVAVGRDGDVFVSTADQGPKELSVLVYHASGTEPYALLEGYFDGDFSLAVDRANDLFVDYFPEESIGTVVGEFVPSGKHQWTAIDNVGFGEVSPWALAFDAAGNLVAAENPKNWDLAVYPPGSTTPQTTIALPNGTNFVESIAFNRRGDAAYAAIITNQVVELTYPGGTVTNVLTVAGSRAWSVAVSPAPKLAPRW